MLLWKEKDIYRVGQNRGVGRWSGPYDNDATRKSGREPSKENGQRPIKFVPLHVKL